MNYLQLDNNRVILCLSVNVDLIICCGQIGVKYRKKLFLAAGQQWIRFPVGDRLSDQVWI